MLLMWCSNMGKRYVSVHISIHDGLTTTTGLTNFRELQAPQATPPPKGPYIELFLTRIHVLY